MATKTIRVREEVYERLAARKRPNESYSDLLERLTDRRSAFEAGFGSLKSVDFVSATAELEDRLEAEFKPAE